MSHSYSPVTRNDFFCTLTFERTHTRGYVLKHFRNDFTTFTRHFKKHFGDIEYLRSVEEHKDNFPHIHLHIICRNFTYTVKNKRYFDDRTFRLLKSTWNKGHSDFQPPRGKGYGVVHYTLKYLNKTSSSNRLWNNLLSTQTVQSVEQSLNTTSQLQESVQNVPIENMETVNPISKTETTSTEPIIKEDPFLYFLVPKSTSLTHSILKKRRMKKITWTRGYIEMLKNMIN